MLLTVTRLSDKLVFLTIVSTCTISRQVVPYQKYAVNSYQAVRQACLFNYRKYLYNIQTFHWSQTLLNYLDCHYFIFERTWSRLLQKRTWSRLLQKRTWSRLLQKRVVRTKFDIYVFYYHELRFSISKNNAVNIIQTARQARIVNNRTYFCVIKTFIVSTTRFWNNLHQMHS